MISTGRPPARCLTSSQYIWKPSFMSLPSCAIPPLSTYSMPILIGACACADGPAASAAPSAASRSHLSRILISVFSSYQCSSLRRIDDNLARLERLEDREAPADAPALPSHDERILQASDHVQPGLALGV